LNTGDGSGVASECDLLRREANELKLIFSAIVKKLE